jgi:methyl-accepting chemotaxis protein
MKTIPKFKLKLTGRIMLTVLGAVLIMNLLILVIIGSSSFNQAKNAGIELALSKSRGVASNVEIYLNQAVEGLNSLSNTVTALKESKNPSRSDINNIIIENLKSNKNYLAIWQMWEKNAFDGNDKAFKNDVRFKLCNGMLNLSYYNNNDEIKLEPGETADYEEDYYTLPKKNGKLSIVEPYLYSYTSDTNNMFYETSIALPLRNKEQIVGVVGIDINLESLSDIVSRETVYETGFSVVVSNELQIAAHPDKNLRGKNLSVLINSNLDSVRDSINKAKVFYYTDTAVENGESVLRCFAPVNIGNSATPWSVMVEIPMKEVHAEARKVIMFIVLIGLGSMLLISLVVYLISRAIANPIRNSSAFAKEIALGNLDAVLKITDRNDEIGDLTRAQKEMADKLKEVIAKIWLSADNIFSASQSLNSTSLSLSEGANEQAASTEEVSSSMEEMVSSINQNADNARQTELIAGKASKDIEQGGIAALSTVEAMKQIAEKITIVGVIAEKTDLLAINAAIEAARAGEHGKGFAVVASEIRKLAERSQDAAKQIDELSRSSVKIANQAGAELQRIVPDIQKTAVLVQDISVASLEQNEGAKQIINAITQLNSVTQLNVSVSEEMATSSEELFAQAEQLKELLGFYRSEELYHLSHSDTFKTEPVKVIEKPGKQEAVKVQARKIINLDDDLDKQYEKY